MLYYIKCVQRINTQDHDDNEIHLKTCEVLLFLLFVKENN